MNQINSLKSLTPGEMKSPSKLEKSVRPNFEKKVSAGKDRFESGGSSPLKTKKTAPQADSWKMLEVDPVQMMKVDEVRKEYGLTGRGVTVAVVDSGFDHPGYELAAWQDCVNVKDLAGSNFARPSRPGREQNAQKPVDEHGHGTYISSCVLKVAPRAKIAGVRVVHNQGALNSWVTRGIEWAIENKDKYGIGVINLSGGSFPQAIPLNSPPYMLRLTGNPICEAIKRAEKAGITVVAAAGNAGPDNFTLHDEANEPEVITVAAARDEKTVSDFSSRGPSLQSGESKPDLTAPGEGIFAWVPQGSLMEKSAMKVEVQRGYKPSQVVRYLKGKPEVIKQMGLPPDILEKSPQEVEKAFKQKLPNIFLPNYAGSAGERGTSPACALVSGVVALMKEADPKLTTPEIKEILTQTARPMGESFNHNDRGAGYVDAKAALDEVMRRKNF